MAGALSWIDVNVTEFSDKFICEVQTIDLDMDLVHSEQTRDQYVLDLLSKSEETTASDNEHK